LLLIAVACKLLLTLLVGPTSSAGASAAERLGQEVGSALVIFLASAVAGGVSAFIRRSRGLDYAGLGAGAVAAIIVTLLLVAGAT
jgi:hypothetical protein